MADDIDAEAFVEAERRLLEPVATGTWEDFNWVAHVRTSHTQALDIIQQQADEIERLKRYVERLASGGRD